jgi:hypothetical protein
VPPAGARAAHHPSALGRRGTGFSQGYGWVLECVPPMPLYRLFPRHPPLAVSKLQASMAL